MLQFLNILYIEIDGHCRFIMLYLYYKEGEMEMKALEITKLEMNREEKLERLSQIKDTKTDVSRIIFVEDFQMEVGQIVDNLGLHWADENDKHFGRDGGYQAEIEGTPVIFRASEVEGYKVKYYHEIWAEENDISYEEEMDLVEKYEPVYQLIGTSEDAFKEAEILISNATKFEVTNIEEPNSEENFYIVDLEVK